MPSPRNGQERNGATARAIALALTNLTKLGGLAIGINEMAFRPETTTPRLAFAAFLMMGAQVAEGAALTFLDHLLGRATPPPKGE